MNKNTNDIKKFGVEAMGFIRFSRSTRLVVFSCIFLFFSQVAADDSLNSINVMISDMSQTGEGYPHGVPESFGWSVQPRIGAGNVPPTNFRSITAWGQIYEAAEGSSANGIRVEVKELGLAVLNKRERLWRCLQYGSLIDGRAFRENFQANQILGETPQPLSVVPRDGYNFHFWPKGPRPEIDAENLDGVLVTFYARLVSNIPNERPDYSAARFVASAGADYWLDDTSTWNNYKTNHEVGIGRFKYITSDWRPFNMITVSREDLISFPPPTDMKSMCGDN